MKHFQTSTDGRSLFFTWENASRVFLNSLMRTCKSLVVSLAFDEVEVNENDSQYLDEFIKLRVQFVPVTLPPSLIHQGWNTKTECPCLKGNCNKCALLFELKAEGKSTYPPSRTTVWSDTFVLKSHSTDPPAVVIMPRIPLLELEAHQKIRLRALVRKGTPSQDAKFLKCVKATFAEEKPYVSSKGTNFVFTESNDKHRRSTYHVCIESLDSLAPAEYLLEAFHLLQMKVNNIIDGL